MYQARAGEMEALPFDECVEEIHKRVIDRMKWVWTDDIDSEYSLAVMQMMEAMEKSDNLK